MNLKTRNFNNVAFAAAFLVTSLVSVSAAFAVVVKGEPIDNPALADEVTFEVVQTGLINVVGSNLQRAEINLTIPQQDAFQDVLRRGGDIIEDHLGNQLLLIRADNPPNDISYSTDTQVVVRAKKVVSLPQSYDIPADAQIYLKPAAHIQSEDTEIEQLAAEITRGAQTDFEKVGKLAIWVNDLMTYDINEAGKTRDALWVLANKRGVCAEYSTLFAALARAAGIPTRYTYVYAYGENGWESHAIAESYIGKWVMVDPLWLQAGYVDATHVRYTVQPDNQIINSVVVVGNVQQGGITWQQDNYEFSTQAVRYAPRFNNHEVETSSHALTPGREFIVFAKMASQDYRLEDLVLKPCRGEPWIVRFVDEKARLIMTPNEEKVAMWWGRVNPELPADVIYTCPLTFNSRYWENKVLELTVSPFFATTYRVSANLEKATLNLGEKQRVIFSIDGERDENVNLTVISGDYAEKRLIPVRAGFATVGSFEFTPDRLGKQTTFLATSNGMVFNATFDVVVAGDIYILDIIMPANVSIGEPANATVQILNQRDAPQQLRVDVDSAGTVIVAQKGITNVTLPIDTSEAGAKRVRVRVSDPGQVHDEELRQLLVVGPEGPGGGLGKILDAIVGFLRSIFEFFAGLFGR